ncbi:hypothetical protein AB0F11_12925 [Streptomyces sp. NPDC032472]|uniref:hypothetical protein n=1 Tax=Streptomyces sp. NPDC032472 TaxID=3155018 RepID=UPI00340712B1
MRRSLAGLKTMYKGDLLNGDLPAMVFTTRMGDRRAVVAKHPLHACERGLASTDLRPALEAALQYTQDAAKIVVADWFTLEKSPIQIIQELK